MKYAITILNSNYVFEDNKNKSGKHDLGNYNSIIWYELRNRRKTIVDPEAVRKENIYNI